MATSEQSRLILAEIYAGRDANTEISKWRILKIRLLDVLDALNAINTPDEDLELLVLEHIIRASRHLMDLEKAEIERHIRLENMPGYREGQ